MITAIGQRIASVIGSWKAYVRENMERTLVERTQAVWKGHAPTLVIGADLKKHVWDNAFKSLQDFAWGCYFFIVSLFARSYRCPEGDNTDETYEDFALDPVETDEAVVLDPEDDGCEVVEFSDEEPI